MVKFVAGRVSAGLPHSIEQADLVSYGMFGLIDAIEKFDTEPQHQVRDLRHHPDQGSDHRRAALHRLGPALGPGQSPGGRAGLRHPRASLGRAPTDAEVAAELQISEAELQQIFGQISYTGIVALDEVISGRSGGPGGDARPSATPSPIRRDGPMAAFEVEEMKQILAGAINRLGDREKIVLTLYYYESLTLAQIGQVLGVTESRVCQIHTKAVMQLRGRMLLADR